MQPASQASGLPQAYQNNLYPSLYQQLPVGAQTQSQQKEMSSAQPQPFYYGSQADRQVVQVVVITQVITDDNVKDVKQASEEENAKNAKTEKRNKILTVIAAIVAIASFVLFAAVLFAQPVSLALVLTTIVVVMGVMPAAILTAVKFSIPVTYKYKDLNETLSTPEKRAEFEKFLQANKSMPISKLETLIKLHQLFERSKLMNDWEETLKNPERLLKFQSYISKLYSRNWPHANSWMESHYDTLLYSHKDFLDQMKNEKDWEQTQKDALLKLSATHMSKLQELSKEVATAHLIPTDKMPDTLSSK